MFMGISDSLLIQQKAHGNKKKGSKIDEENKKRVKK